MTGAAPRPGWDAIQAAVERAKLAHTAVSAEERDRLLRLSPVDRLAAIEDHEGWSVLLPEDRQAVLASLAAALPQPSAPDPTEEEMRAEHEREMAAWRADLAARDAALAQAKQRQRLLVWAPWVAAGVLLVGWLLR